MPPSGSLTTFSWMTMNLEASCRSLEEEVQSPFQRPSEKYASACLSDPALSRRPQLLCHAFLWSLAHHDVTFLSLTQ
ncbi:hypothetical protein CLOM_g3772 [Closterium sp. NIES-68]|nr:hypothetical protein CLOM_g3772 [Closterium sp. NIES-68]GJP62132.1 hypothetical protein CLOP_g19225 [Closterium sp. NIES-67]